MTMSFDKNVADEDLQGRTADLHDHGKLLSAHGTDLAAAHGRGLEGHGTDLGAHAFTTGSDILFRPAPELHTAAHEMAHVVQQ
jgi:hypothetical protein